jgi:DNA polymerase-3 subunit delta'
MIHRMLLGRRLPHALLFRGPAGVGKKLFARGLAAALNCRGGLPGLACGTCASCHKLLSGNHPDFLVIQPEKDAIKIDQVRAMSRATTYPPYESPYRVIVLEDAHAMQAAAANSLLKTLEEPPPGNVLILTAEASREVLPTIVSRCQVVPFSALSDDQTLAIINRLLPELDAEMARLAARFAAGSPGRALRVHENNLLDLLRRLLAALAVGANSPTEAVLELLPLAEEMAEQKENLPLFFELIRTALAAPIFGQCLFASPPGSSPGGFSFREISARLSCIDTALRQLARNCNRALVCEVLLFHLTSGAFSPTPRP